MQAESNAVVVAEESVEGKEAGGRKALYTASSRKAGQSVEYLSVENCEVENFGL